MKTTKTAKCCVCKSRRANPAFEGVALCSGRCMMEYHMTRMFGPKKQRDARAKSLRRAIARDLNGDGAIVGPVARVGARVTTTWGAGTIVGTFRWDEHPGRGCNVELDKPCRNRWGGKCREITLNINDDGRVDTRHLK